jgi:hypothetical protein
VFGRDSLGMLLEGMAQGTTIVQQAKSTAEECCAGIWAGVVVPRVVQIPRWNEPHLPTSIEDCAGNPLGPEQWAEMGRRRLDLGLLPWDPNDETRDYRAEAEALGAPFPDWTVADRFTPLTYRITRVAEASLNPRATMDPFDKFPKFNAYCTTKYGKVLGFTGMPVWHSQSERWIVADSPEEGLEIGVEGRPEAAAATRQVRPGLEKAAQEADATWRARQTPGIPLGHATTGLGFMGG